MLSPHYYFLVQKLLNHSRKLPLSYISRVLASHSFLSALDDINALYADCIWQVNTLTLKLLMPYIYGAPSKARNANVVYIWTYVWQR